jgi:hypothetical protein
MNKRLTFRILLISGLFSLSTALSVSQTDSLDVKGLRVFFAKPDRQVWAFSSRSHVSTWGILKFESVDGSQLSLFYEDMAADSASVPLVIGSDSMSFYMDDSPFTEQSNDSMITIGITTRQVPFHVSSCSIDSGFSATCAQSYAVSGWYATTGLPQRTRTIALRQFTCNKVSVQALCDLTGQFPVEHIAKVHWFLDSVHITTR